MLQHYQSLRKYFINLDRRPDRLNFFLEQVGTDFERIQAFDGRKLTFSEIDDIFDMRKCNEVYKVNQTKAQAAATCSHFKIYKIVNDDDSIKDEDFILISEDDNKFDQNFRKKLDQIIEFLKDDKFEFLDIVILKYGVSDYIFDYANVLRIVPKSLNFQTKEQAANLAKSNPELSEDIYKLVGDAVANYIRFHNFKKNVYSFDYKNLPESFVNNQKFVNSYRFYPFAASLYLIRKKTIKKILEKYKKPWWYADDFKQIVPIQNIFFASPFLSSDSEVGYVSSIINEKDPYRSSDPQVQDEFIRSNFHYNQVTTGYHYKLFNRLDKYGSLISFQYSRNKLYRKLSLILQKILLLR